MKTSGKTDIGKNRDMNQDFMFMSDTSVGNLPNLYILADGMGGHNAGEYASQKSVEVIVEEIIKSKDKEPSKLLNEAIEKANLRIFEDAISDNEKSGMGTTIVAVTFIGDTAYVANVGDSRLYIVTDGLNQVTTDHSLVEEMVRKGQLSRDKTFGHPDKNIITRAVGVTESVTADIFEQSVNPGDKILMCSDGLTDMVSEDDIYSIISKNDDMDRCVDELIATANANGGKDNVTIIIIEV